MQLGSHVPYVAKSSLSICEYEFKHDQGCEINKLKEHNFIIQHTLDSLPKIVQYNDIRNQIGLFKYICGNHRNVELAISTNNERMCHKFSIIGGAY
jgi:hypothetical protein